MNDVLKVTLSLSLSGSLLILIFFAGRYFLKDKLSRQWQYYIWLIVIARLLLPFAPETNVTGSFLRMLENAAVPISVQAETDGSADLPEDSALDDPAPGSEQTGETGYGTQPALPSDSRPFWDIILLLKNNLWLVWLVTALILLIRKVTVYQSFVRYVKAGLTPVSDVALLNRLAVIGKQAGVNRPVELCVNPLISSPLLIGFFRPCIVLPDQNLSDRDFLYTALHELTHFKRFDLFYKWLVQVTVCLHWYNPLVFLMGREINRACEFSCDEAVVSGLESNSLQDYGKTLLNAMTAAGKLTGTTASVTLSGNKKLLKERLDAIMKFKRKSKKAAGAAVLLSCVLFCGAVYAGAYTADRDRGNNRNSAGPDKRITADASDGFSDKNNSQKSEDAERTEKEENYRGESRTESLKRSFEKYKSFGVVYDEQEDAVFFRDERVKLFVDFSQDKEEEMNYSFDLCYQDSNTDSTLCLEAVEDSDGSIVEIRLLEDEIVRELIGGREAALSGEPVFPNTNKYGNDWHYVCMDATQIVERYEITAKDITKENADETVHSWIRKCDSKKGVYTLKQQTAAGYTTYIYYNGGGRYPWNLSIDGDTVIINLYSDSSLMTDDGYYLMYFSSPEEYHDIALYLDGSEL